MVDMVRAEGHGRPFRSENPYQFEFWYVERIFGTRFAGTVRGTDFRSGFLSVRYVVRILVRARTWYGTWYGFWYEKIRTGTDFFSVRYLVRSKISKNWKNKGAVPDFRKMKKSISDKKCKFMIRSEIQRWITCKGINVPQWPSLIRCRLDHLFMSCVMKLKPLQQGSTHRLVRGPLGASWCEIFQVSLVLVRCGPTFQNNRTRQNDRLRCVDPWSPVVGWQPMQPSLSEFRFVRAL